MKFAASQTLKRVGVSVLIVSSLLAATGCGYIYKQPTTIIYSASDGQMTQLGKDILLRNIMVISSGAEDPGRLLGTVLNETEQDATVSIAFPNQTVTLNVPAGQEIRLENDENRVILNETGANPGLTLLDVQVSSNVTGETSSFNVPVLDGTLDEYAPYLPNAASATATASQGTGH